MNDVETKRWIDWEAATFAAVWVVAAILLMTLVVRVLNASMPAPLVCPTPDAEGMLWYEGQTTEKNFELWCRCAGGSPQKSIGPNGYGIDCDYETER